MPRPHCGWQTCHQQIRQIAIRYMALVTMTWTVNVQFLASLTEHVTQQCQWRCVHHASDLLSQIGAERSPGQWCRRIITMNVHEGKPVKSGIAHGTPLPGFQPLHTPVVLKEHSQQQEPTGNDSSNDSSVSVFGNNLFFDTARCTAPAKDVISRLDLHTVFLLWTSLSNVELEGRLCLYWLHGFDVITGQRMNISWYYMPRQQRRHQLLWEVKQSYLKSYLRCRRLVDVGRRYTQAQAKTSVCVAHVWHTS